MKKHLLIGLMISMSSYTSAQINRFPEFEIKPDGPDPCKAWMGIEPCPYKNPTTTRTNFSSTGEPIGFDTSNTFTSTFLSQIARYGMSKDITGLHISGNDGLKFYTDDIERISVVGPNVGIGKTNPMYKLEVNGTMHSKEVKVDMSGWADFVFKSDYQLPTLKEVENHIKEKGHLPNIPSEQEVIENGISLGETQKLLLQKIEELTLYIIDQNKKIEKLEEQVKSLHQ